MATKFFLFFMGFLTLLCTTLFAKTLKENDIAEGTGLSAFNLPTAPEMNENIYKKYYIEDNINLYNGQITFSIPLFSLRIKGLQPIQYDLNLQYDGDNLFELTASNDVKQSSWVGVGFKLQLMFIKANNKGTREWWDDDYEIDFGNGKSDKLILVDNTEHEFTTLRYSNYKIYRVINNKDVIGWKIIDPEGIIYLLGDMTDEILGEQKSTVVKLAWNNWIGDGYEDGYSYVPTQWYISKMENAFGVNIKFYYQQDEEKLRLKNGPNGEKTFSTLSFTKAIYPKFIITSSNEKVEFLLEKREPEEWLDIWGISSESEDNYDEYQEFYQQYALDRISYYYNNNLLYEYLFTYYPPKEVGEENEGRKKRFLKEIKQIKGHNSVPGYSFEYYGFANNETESEMLGKLEKITYPTGGYTNFTYSFRTNDDFYFESNKIFSLEDKGWLVGGDGNALVFAKNENTLVVQYWNGFRYRIQELLLPFSVNPGDDVWETDFQVTVKKDLIFVTPHTKYNENTTHYLVVFKKTLNGYVELFHKTFNNVYDIQPVNENYIFVYKKYNDLSHFYGFLYKIENNDVHEVYNSYNRGEIFNLGLSYEDHDYFNTLRVIPLSNCHFLISDGNRSYILGNYTGDEWQIIGDDSPGIVRAGYDTPLGGSGNFIRTNYTNKIVGNKIFSGISWEDLSNFPDYEYNYGSGSETNHPTEPGYIKNIIYYVENKNLYKRTYLSNDQDTTELIIKNFFDTVYGDVPTLSFLDGYFLPHQNHMQFFVRRFEEGSMGEWSLANKITGFIRLKDNNITPSFRGSDALDLGQYNYYYMNEKDIVRIYRLNKNDDTGDYAQINDITFLENGANLSKDSSYTYLKIGDSFKQFSLPVNTNDDREFWYRYQSLSEINSVNFLGILGNPENNSFKYYFFDPRNKYENNALTLKIPVVTSKITNDGNDNIKKVDYEYFDGVYRLASLSLNFNRVKETLDLNNNEIFQSISRFYNDLDDNDNYDSDNDGIIDVTFPDLDNSSLGNGYVLDGKLYSKKIFSDEQTMPVIEESYNYYANLKNEKEEIYDIQLIEQDILKNNVSSKIKFQYNKEGFLKEKKEYFDTDNYKSTYYKYAYEVNSGVKDKNQLKLPYLELIGDKNSYFDDINSSDSLLSATITTVEYDPDFDTYIAKKIEKWNDEKGNADKKIDEDELIITQNIISYDGKGMVTEVTDGRGISMAVQYSEKSFKPIASVTNGAYNQFFVDDFSDYADSSDPLFLNRWAVEEGTVDIENGRLKIENNFVATQTDWAKVEHSLPINNSEYFNFETDIILSENSDIFNIFVKQNDDKNIVQIQFNNSGTILVSNNGVLQSINLNYEKNKKYHIRISVNMSDFKWFLNLNGDDFGPFSWDTSINTASKIVFEDFKNDGFALIDNIRVFPFKSKCTSYIYDKNSNQLKQIIDSYGNAQFYYYDDFDRLTRILDDNQYILSEYSYFLSRELNDTYNSSDPNYIKNIEYSSDTNIKSANLAPNYGFELDHPAGNQKPSFWHDDLYNAPLEAFNIVENGVNNSLCVQLGKVGLGANEHIQLSTSQSIPFTLEYSQDIDWASFLGITSQPDGTTEPDSSQAVPENDYFQIRRDDETIIVYSTSTNSRTTEYNVAAGTYYAETNGLMEGDVWYQNGKPDGKVSIVSDFITLNGEDTYLLSGYIKTEDGALASFGIRWFDVNFNPISTVYIANEVESSSWTSYSSRINRPDEAYYAKIIASNSTNRIPAYFDNISFSAGDAESDIKKKIITYYFDGLGREIQVQTTKYFPHSDEIGLNISGYEYDALDRKSRDFLPLDMTMSDLLNNNYSLHSFIDAYKSLVNNYYGSEDGEAPYYETEYVNYPDDRVKAKYSPGNMYKKGGTHHITYEYRANNADEAYGYSEANTLYKTIEYDDTFGDQTIINHSFSDVFGNTVESIQDVGGLDLHTVFKYDVLGRLKSSFAPKGYEIYENDKNNEYHEIIIKDMNIIAANISDQIYTQRIPVNDSLKYTDVILTYTAQSEQQPSVEYTLEYFSGASWHSIGSYTIADTGTQGTKKQTYYIPAEATKVRLTLNGIEPANQADRAVGYQDYELNLQVGYYQKAVLEDFESKYVYNSLSEKIKEEHPDDGTAEYKYDKNGNLRFKRDARYNALNQMVYYNYDNLERITEIGICTDAKAYFRDSYAYEEQQIDPAYIISQVQYIYDSDGYPGARNLQGRLAKKIIKDYYDYHYEFYSYDERGQIEWIVQKLYNKSEDRYLEKKIEYEYDLQGNIRKIAFNPGNPDALYYYYEYDPTGALLAIYTNTTDDRNGAKLEITYNETDAAGRQKQVVYGDNIQSMDYQYNVRGWLTQINDAENLGNDKFAMKFFYNGEDFEQMYYNGLISGIELHYPAINGVTESRYRYGFEYDALSRLKNAQHYWPEYEGPEQPGVISAWSGDEKYKVFNITYDANGNILSLKRYDENGTILNDGSKIHDFTYQYASKTNKLRNFDGSGDDFAYDPAGNMVQDTYRDISSINYNYQNLPEKIDFGSGGGMVFAYDDRGNRIAKHEYRYYIRGMNGEVLAEYDENNALKIWRLGDFGHKMPDGTSYYYLKDHLGNIRVTVNDQGELVTKDDYYPFGLQMPILSYNNGNPNDNWKYSSKELDKEHGLDWYYFGARYYDPAIGRWLSMDPKINEYPHWSPYNYVGNDPIGFWDNNGELRVSGSGRYVSRVPQTLVKLQKIASYSPFGSVANIAYKLIINDPSYKVNAYDIGSLAFGLGMKGITQLAHFTTEIAGFSLKTALKTNESVMSSVINSLVNCIESSEQDKNLFIDEQVFYIAEKSHLGNISISNHSLFEVSLALIGKLPKKEARKLVKLLFKRIDTELRKLAEDNGFDLNKEDDREKFNKFIQDGGADELIKTMSYDR